MGPSGGQAGAAELELSPAGLELLPRRTTSAKEVTSETLEGRPDLPSEEDELNTSHSGSSSGATPGQKEGEKGEAWGLRVEGGEGLATAPAVKAAGEQGGEGGGERDMSVF
jgi:hypothetical protein